MRGSWLAQRSLRANWITGERAIPDIFVPEQHSFEVVQEAAIAGYSRGARVYIPAAARIRALSGAGAILDRYDLSTNTPVLVGYKGQYFLSRTLKKVYVPGQATDIQDRGFLSGADLRDPNIARLFIPRGQATPDVLARVTGQGYGREKLRRQAFGYNRYMRPEIDLSKASAISKILNGGIPYSNLNKRILTPVELVAAFNAVDRDIEARSSLSKRAYLTKVLNRLSEPVSAVSGYLSRATAMTANAGALAIKGLANFGGNLRGAALPAFNAVIAGRLFGVAAYASNDLIERTTVGIRNFGQSAAEYGPVGTAFTGIYNEFPFARGAVDRVTGAYQDAANLTARELKADINFGKPGYLQNNLKVADQIWERNLRNSKLQARETFKVFKLVNEEITSARYEAAGIMRDNLSNIFRGLIETLWSVLRSIRDWLMGYSYAIRRV